MYFFLNTNCNNKLRIFLFFLIEEKIKKFKRSRLRKIIRGYNFLKKSGRLGAIYKVKEALTNEGLNLNSKNYSKFFMGEGFTSSENIIKQYLLIRVGGLDFNSALLQSYGGREKVVFPIPKKWREILIQHGFDIDNIKSSLLWRVYILSLFFYGCWKALEIFIYGLLNSESITPKNYVYFDSLVSSNLSADLRGRKRYNFLAWYLQSSEKLQNLKEIRHSVNNIPNKMIGDIALTYQKSNLPDLPKKKLACKFLFLSLRLIFISFVDLLRGRWWHALLLNQALLAKKVNLLPVNLLASEYFFHNSEWIYRPLWTYEAEKVGSIITFYFYSINMQPFMSKKLGRPIPFYGYKLMSWSRYLVWDNYQASYIKKLIQTVNCKIVGPIWFEDGGVYPHLPQTKKVIAIFDVQPFRSSIYMTLGLEYEYYTFINSYQFLVNICESFSNDSYKICFKRKRNIGSLAHPLYRKLLRKLEASPNFSLVHEDISAVSLIKRSDIVISMPFTSTALIAHELGKLTIFYDPTGELDKNDPAAHGINVLSGKSELNQWIKSLDQSENSF